MKNAKRIWIALLAAFLLVAGNMDARPQSARQTGDQAKVDANATKPAEKNNAGGAPTTKKNNSANPAPANAATAAVAAAPPAGAPASAPSSTAPATQKTSPPNNAGTVWVNTESGVYHKPGTRWYGRTKQGKYMTEANAIKAGYKASGKN